MCRAGGPRCDGNGRKATNAARATTKEENPEQLTPDDPRYDADYEAYLERSRVLDEHVAAGGSVMDLMRQEAAARYRAQLDEIVARDR